MKKISDKKIDDFARIYIGSQMIMIDGSAVGKIGEEIDIEEEARIINRIREIGHTILGKRKFCTDPTQILYNLAILPKK